MPWELFCIICEWIEEGGKVSCFNTYFVSLFWRFFFTTTTTTPWTFSLRLSSRIRLYVCLETHHMLEQSIHKFAMSNSVKFFSLSMLEEEISSERISLAQQLFSLVVWTLTNRKKLSCFFSPQLFSSYTLFSLLLANWMWSWRTEMQYRRTSKECRITESEKLKLVRFCPACHSMFKKRRNSFSCKVV